MSTTQRPTPIQKLNKERVGITQTSAFACLTLIVIAFLGFACGFGVHGIFF